MKIIFEDLFCVSTIANNVSQIVQKKLLRAPGNILNKLVISGLHSAAGRESGCRSRHYENTPFQIYWKFHHQNLKGWGGSNEYPQSMFLNRNKKNNVYPCKLVFYYIKVGFNEVKII